MRTLFSNFCRIKVLLKERDEAMAFQEVLYRPLLQACQRIIPVLLSQEFERERSEKENRLGMVACTKIPFFSLASIHLYLQVEQKLAMTTR